jgi:hypothetical protein
MLSPCTGTGYAALGRSVCGYGKGSMLAGPTLMTYVFSL